MLGQSGFMICLGCFKSHHNGLFSVGHGQTDTILGGNGHQSLLYFNSPSRVAGDHYFFSQLLNWNRIECLKLSTNAWCFSDNYEFLALPPPPHKSQLICRKSASHRLRLAGWARSLLTKSVGCLSCLLVSGSRHHNPQSTTTFPKPSRMKPTERLAPSHLSVSGVLVAVPWRVGKWQYQPKI